MGATGAQRVHVYCSAYDDFLSESASKPKCEFVYVSYKGIDNLWRLRLREWLDADRRIRVWDDSLLSSGDYREQMRNAVSRCRGMVVLASQEYLDSPLPTELELTPAFEAANDGELTLLWAPVRRFDWKHSPFERFMIPLDANEALTDMSEPQWRAALRRLYERVCKDLGLGPLPQDSNTHAENG